MINRKVMYYIGNFDRPEKNAAGKRVYGNALIFSSLGYKVVLVGKSKSDYVSESPQSYGKDIIYYSFPNIGLLNTKEYMRFLENLILRTGDKPELIVRYGSPAIAFFDKFLLKFCKKKSIKIVADIVDWLPPGGSNLIFNIIKKIDTYLEKGIYNRKSDGIIAISSYLSKYYKFYGCQVVTIPPIVEEYKKNQRKNDKINIIYAGIPFRLGKKVTDFSSVKDRLDLAIVGLSKAAQEGVDVLFNIYGISQREYLTAYPDYKELLEESKECIIFHGKKSNQEVQEAINAADFTILLREKNRASMAGFPTKIVESLSCGTPVITTRTSDLEQFIRHKQNGFFIDIANEDNFTKELLEALRTDTETIYKMKQICYKDKQFIPENFITEMEEFLQKI